MDKFYDMNEQWIEKKKNDWKAKYSNLKNKMKTERKNDFKKFLYWLLIALPGKFTAVW